MLKKIFILFILSCSLSSCGVGKRGSYTNNLYLSSLNKIEQTKVSMPVERRIKHIISIRTQEQFDILNKRITEEINRGGKNIVVKIYPGTYFFNDGHIRRINEKSDVSISIEGNNSVLIAKGKNYHDGDDCPSGLSVLSTLVDVNTLSPYSSWEALRFSDKLVEVVNEKSKLCRLHHSELPDYSEEDCASVYIHITEWYQSFLYRVKYIKNGWVYFVAGNLAKSVISNKGEYNLNDDYLYARTFPRFRLCNLPNSKGPVGISGGKAKTATGSIYVCEAANFLMLDNVEYKSVTLKGLRFIGNSNDPSLISLNKTKCGLIKITDCTFESLYSRIINATLSSNIVFDNNKVKGCYTTALCFRNGCEKVRVTGNVFENGSQCVSFSFFVQCEAKDFYIANNTFRNFGYSAIAAGLMRDSDKKYECSGIIENNELYFTKDYFDNKDIYTSMDAGAIQVRTQSDQTVIRYNYIHDYVGMKDNRGIFCDEGARNFKIYNNVILNTPNSYSIDARRVNDRSAADTLNNRNNIVMNNIVDNRIRFQGRDVDNNGCVKIGNVTLIQQGKEKPAHQYGRLDVYEEDNIVEYEISGSTGSYRITNPEMIKTIDEMPGYYKIKRYLKRIR